MSVVLLVANVSTAVKWVPQQIQVLWAQTQQNDNRVLVTFSGNPGYLSSFPVLVRVRPCRTELSAFEEARRRLEEQQHSGASPSRVLGTLLRVAVAIATAPGVAVVVVRRASAQAGSVVANPGNANQQAVSRLVQGLPMPVATVDGLCSGVGQAPVAFGFNATTNCAIPLTASMLADFCQ